MMASKKKTDNEQKQLPVFWGDFTLLKHLSSRFGSTDGLPLPSYLTCFEFEHDVI